MALSPNKPQLGKTLIEFSERGAYPDEEAVSAAYLDDSALPAALVALNDAKLDLEDEIRAISHESAGDIDSWIGNARTLQDDIDLTQRLSSDILRQAKFDEHREEILQDKQVHLDFLSREVAYHEQLLETLRSLEKVNISLDEVEKLAEERDIVRAVQVLDDTDAMIKIVPLEQSAHVTSLLYQRWYRLKDIAHEYLKVIWAQLVCIDDENHSLTIKRALARVPIKLEDALMAWRLYKELDVTAVNFCREFDIQILRPRTDIRRGFLNKITVNEKSIIVSEEAEEHTLKSLFRDVESIIKFISSTFQPDFVQAFSKEMMTILSPRIKEDWLDSAVPASLDDMADYKTSMAYVQEFAERLDELSWPGSNIFHDWASGASKIWLAKRRESALDWVRNELALGIRSPQSVERLETRMLDKDEGSHVAATNNVVSQDWDAAWDTDEGDDQNHSPSPKRDLSPAARPRNRLSMIELEQKSGVVQSPLPTVDDEDAADAWGWGDEDENNSPTGEDNNSEPKPTVSPEINTQVTTEKRQVTVSEKYCTSSMPQSVLRSLLQIFDDGATLLGPGSEEIPVASAAAGLFSLPTLILAMYRAVGPFYYSFNPSGNMFLYNDAIWLVGQLQEFVKAWILRTDLPPRALKLLRIDNEIQVMESFGKRAYANELNAQRTVINDLLGGTQNFFQGEGWDQNELEIKVVNVIGHIRSKALAWGQILTPSALSSALGSLVNTLAKRLINDVLELSSIGVPEGETAGYIIKRVVELDELFLPSTKNGHQNGNHETATIPTTSQYADKWVRLQFLGHLLDCDSSEVVKMWFESHLSRNFTAEEVVDFMEASFENNPTVRSRIRKIKENPYPIIVD